jgi:hypothetical protein
MDEQTSQSGAAFKIGDLLDLGTRHFALLSAGLIMLGGFTATIFLAAYLRAFDWRLIWIIEPSDILKVGILCLAFLSGFVYLLQAPLNWTADWEKYSPLNKRVSYAVAFFVFSLVILQDERSTEPHLFLHLSIFGFLAFLFSAVLFIRRNASRFAPDYWSYYFAVLALIGLVAFIGNIVGLYVKEIGGFTENVWTKNEKFQNVVVIISTSHHTALLTKDNGVVVLPSADILKMQSSAAQ